MKLTLKKFIIELLTNFLAFTILCFLFIFIFFRHDWKLFASEAFSMRILCTLIVWMSFSMGVFYTVFFEIFPGRHYKKAARNFLLLFIGIYLFDSIIMSIIVHENHIL
jgi:hypothetical protein